MEIKKESVGQIRRRLELGNRDADRRLDSSGYFVDRDITLFIQKKQSRFMNHLDTTWLCALLISSGKISACDIAPADLEYFEPFISILPRQKLIALEDALESAVSAMSEVDGERAVELTQEIVAMWEIVFDRIYETNEVKDFVESLMKI